MNRGRKKDRKEKKEAREKDGRKEESGRNGKQMEEKWKKGRNKIGRRKRREGERKKERKKERKNARNKECLEGNIKLQRLTLGYKLRRLLLVHRCSKSSPLCLMF